MEGDRGVMVLRSIRDSIVKDVRKTRTVASYLLNLEEDQNSRNTFHSSYLFMRRGRTEQSQQAPLKLLVKDGRKTRTVAKRSTQATC